MTATRTIRIFLSSPSDVEDERDAAIRVIEDLRDYAARELDSELEPLDWRTLDMLPDVGLNLPLDLQIRPQQVVFDAFPVEKWNIFVGILWDRFGTPTGAYNTTFQKRFESGTEEEFTRAYELNRISDRPVLMLYRCGRKQPSYLINPVQMQRVSEFFDLFRTGRIYQGLLIANFDATNDFEARLRRDLYYVLRDYFAPKASR